MHHSICALGRFMKNYSCVAELCFFSFQERVSYLVLFTSPTNTLPISSRRWHDQDIIELLSRRTHSFHLIKDVRAKSGPRGRRYQNTRNVHLRISENVPPRDTDGRPGSCISVTHYLPFRIEIRRLNGHALLFV
jgi:hypothetical protein